jgi:flagellar biosynthetic protein FliP
MKRLIGPGLGLLALLLLAGPAWAQGGGLQLPSITLGVSQAKSPQEVSTALQVVMLLTVLTLAPAIVVFSMLRNALGTQQMPPTQIIIGLALFLSFFVMGPVFSQVNDKALTPYLDGRISQEKFLEEAANPFKEFMLKQTRKKDLALFIHISGEEKPQNAAALSMTSLIPAFVISELKTAFEIGFLLYVPFLVIDMVVASVLLSMGMMMLPPVMVSLPFKLMIFVLVDGWNLLVGWAQPGWRDIGRRRHDPRVHHDLVQGGGGDNPDAGPAHTGHRHDRGPDHQRVPVGDPDPGDDAGLRAQDPGRAVGALLVRPLDALQDPLLHRGHHPQPSLLHPLRGGRACRSWAFPSSSGRPSCSSSCARAPWS